MSTFAKSKSSTGKNKSARSGRDFPAGILAQAEALADQYQVVIRYDKEAGEYYGHGLELPLCMGDGPNPDACIKHTRKAMVAVVATMLEANQTPPVAAALDAAKRDQQINVRLTADEKNALEDAARRKGFEGVSDFVRNAAMAVAK